MIAKEDIMNVAKRIGIELTSTEVEWIRLCYDDAQRQDPTGTWDLVVEDLVYQAEIFRNRGNP